MKYSRSLKDYRDWHNTLNHAIEEKTAQISKKLLAKGRKEGIAVGREEGRENTQKEIAMRLLDMQMEVEKIAQISDLTIEEILALKK